MHSLQRFLSPSGEYLSVTNSEVAFSAKHRSHCLLLTVGTRTCEAGLGLHLGLGLRLRVQLASGLAFGLGFGH